MAAFGYKRPHGKVAYSPTVRKDGGANPALPPPLPIFQETNTGRGDVGDQARASRGSGGYLGGVGTAGSCKNGRTLPSGRMPQVTPLNF